MRKKFYVLLTLAMLGNNFDAWASEGQIATPAGAATEKPDATEGKDISEFLTDKDAGQISASSLVGVANSAITNIQTAQDVILAFKPSDGSSKSGFGISITPARTSITPMSASRYYNGKVLDRMLGALTVSYATKDVDVSGLTLTKRAISIDTLYYFDKNQDPIIAGFNALRKCDAADSAWESMKIDGDKNDRVAFELDTQKYAASLKTCLDHKKKELQWNAMRISIALGSGQVSGENLKTRSMGNAIVINAMLPLGQRGALQPLLRKTWNEVDLKTLASDTKSSSSSLIASRFTYGLQDDGRLQVLAEISNLKKTSLAQSESLFKNSIGIDYAIAKGVWLQLRYGNSRKANDDSSEKRGLLTLHLSPSCILSEKCGK